MVLLTDAPSCNMTIDKSEGANNSSRSLKYEATEIMDAEKLTCHTHYKT